jgi:Rps23 Pro-64 3,4-dihydroxylase Tpa1-like proline 4-hydroxylase
MKNKINYLTQSVVKRNFLSKEECEYLVNTFNISEKKRYAFTNDISTVKIQNVDVYKSDLVVDVILSKINIVVRKFNENFQFNIKRELTDSVVIKYSKGNYIDWHQDLGEGDTALRKINAIVLLSDQETFQGGELEYFDKEIVKTNMNQGDLIVILPFLQHHVSEVTDGVRYSLVTQAVGRKPYR